MPSSGGLRETPTRVEATSETAIWFFGRWVNESLYHSKFFRREIIIIHFGEVQAMMDSARFRKTITLPDFYERSSRVLVRQEAVSLCVSFVAEMNLWSD